MLRGSGRSSRLLVSSLRRTIGSVLGAIGSDGRESGSPGRASHDVAGVGLQLGELLEPAEMLQASELICHENIGQGIFVADEVLVVAQLGLEVGQQHFVQLLLCLLLLFLGTIESRSHSRVEGSRRVPEPLQELSAMLRLAEKSVILPAVLFEEVHRDRTGLQDHRTISLDESRHLPIMK